MSVFTSDKAPYVIALLVSILGWHVSQLAADIRSTRAVSYSIDIDPATREVTATVTNVSRTNSLAKAEFALSCPGGQPCLVPRKSQIFHFLTILPPNAPSATNIIVSDPREVAVRTTLAAGGRFQFGGTLLPGAITHEGDPIEFFFRPDPDRPLDIYVYDSETVFGFTVANYFSIVLISFLVLAVLLMVLIALPLAPLIWAAGRKAAASVQAGKKQNGKDKANPKK